MGPNNDEKEPYPMVDILNLALPYFGLIFIGFACGKAKGLPEQGLAWMNFFLLYVSLPALLFGIMSKTPFAELNNPPFPFGRVPWEVPAVIAVKLLIHPLIVFGLMLLMGPFPQPWATTAILMASLPPARNVLVIARQHETWIEPASVAVLIGTFASVITLTSVMWFIQTGRLVFP
jgi:predicted permease